MLEHPVVAKGHPGQVYGQGIVHALIPGGGIFGIPLQAVTDHPAIETRNQLVAFGHRQEAVGRDDRTVLVQHAHQHLDMQPRRCAVRQRHDLLAVKHQAVGLDGMRDTRYPLHLVLATQQLLVVRLVDMHPAPATILGCVTGNVGLGHDMGYVLTGRCNLADTDTGAHRKEAAAACKSQGLDIILDLVYQLPGGSRRAVPEQQAELVTAQPRNHVRIPHMLAQHFGNLCQQLIACLMRAGLVDDLELVYIHDTYDMIFEGAP